MKTLPTLLLSILLTGCSYNGTCDAIDRGVNNLIEHRREVRLKRLMRKQEKVEANWIPELLEQDKSKHPPVRTKSTQDRL